MVYFVIRRRFKGDTMEDIREGIKRTEDVNQTALTLTEFIEKEGDEAWTGKILEDLGPWMMVQLCDTANALEVFRKSVIHSQANLDHEPMIIRLTPYSFYEWTVPSRTMATLAIFLVAILFTIFAPAWLLIKSTTLGAGFTFFGLFPLAANYPDYRLLASVPRRIFWNIPTHGQSLGTAFWHSWAAIANTYS